MSSIRLNREQNSDATWVSPQLGIFHTRSTLYTGNLFRSVYKSARAGQFNRYRNWLLAGRSGDRILLGARFTAPVHTRPWGPPNLLYNGYRVFPGGKERPGRDADPSPPSSAVVMKGQSCTSTLPTGRTTCIELQCLYKGTFYLTLPYTNPVH